jgi:hypothetical protein
VPNDLQPDFIEKLLNNHLNELERLTSNVAVLPETNMNSRSSDLNNQNKLRLQTMHRPLSISGIRFDKRVLESK